MLKCLGYNIGVRFFATLQWCVLCNQLRPSPQVKHKLFKQNLLDGITKGNSTLYNNREITTEFEHQSEQW